MTIAVCTKCGEVKHGALTPCPFCSFDPELSEDKAKAMVLTDHFLPKEELEKISEQLKNGQSVTYPDEVVQEYIKTFEENPEAGQNPGKFIIGCLIVVCLIIAIVIWLIVKFT